MRKYKMQICIAAAVALLSTADFCGFHIYQHYAQVDKQTEAFEQMAAELVKQAPVEETAPDETPVSEGENVLARYNELYLQNADMVGWISIVGCRKRREFIFAHLILFVQTSIICTLCFGERIYLNI